MSLPKVAIVERLKILTEGMTGEQVDELLDSASKLPRHPLTNKQRERVDQVIAIIQADGDYSTAILAREWGVTPGAVEGALAAATVKLRIAKRLMGS